MPVSVPRTMSLSRVYSPQSQCVPIVRLGISGSHATGKSTLAEELRARLPDYSFIEEPYHQFVEQGHDFGAKPTTDDIELQLRRSIDLLGSTGDRNVVFERCPLDFLAYLIALHAGAEVLRYWFKESRPAMATLDAVVFVRLEQPDRIIIGRDDLPKLRTAVDRRLREGLLEDRWGFGMTVHECHGSAANRAGQVLNWINLHDIVAQ